MMTLYNIDVFLEKLYLLSEEKMEHNQDKNEVEVFSSSNEYEIN